MCPKLHENVLGGGLNVPYPYCIFPLKQIYILSGHQTQGQHFLLNMNSLMQSEVDAF